MQVKSLRLIASPNWRRDRFATIYGSISEENCEVIAYQPPHCHAAESFPVYEGALFS